MKTFSVLSVIAVSASILLGAEPLTDPLPLPPDDAKAGAIYDGVQIGLWTQKETYTGNEIRNVWIFARKKSSSKITIGVGGNLYQDSFLFITDANKQVTRIPISGGADGMTDASGFAGGISDQLARLPHGSYDLVWKTDRLESNTIHIDLQ